MGYKKQAVKSVSWLSLLQVLTRLIGVVKIVIIAKILTPFDFGLFAIVTVVIGITEIFSEFGIQTFLIQYKKDIKEYIDAAWILQIIRGFCLFLVVVAIAFPASIFFREKSLFFLIFLGAFNPLIKGFENSYIVNFQKELLFHKEFIYRFLIVLVDLLASVSITIITHSVVGLIFGMLFSSLIGTLYAWFGLKEKPRFRFNLKKIKKIIDFGKWININSIVYYITSDLDAVVIGRILGSSSLGFYQIAQKFSFTPMQDLADIFGKVSFPVYSKISHDIGRLRKAYFKTIVLLFFLQSLVALFLFLFSKEIILLLLGSQWIMTEGLFKAFIIYGWVATLIGTNGSLFLSLGQQSFLSKLSILRIIVLIPLITIFVIKFGALGAVYALTVSIVIVAPISFLNTFLQLRDKS